MTDDCRAPRVQHVHGRNTASRREEQRAGTCAWRDEADDNFKEGRDASALRHFVNLVSWHINSVLSKSHKSRRAVDHGKYLQRQLARLLKTASGKSLPISANTTSTDSADTEQWSSGYQSDPMTNICSSKDRVSSPEKYPFLMQSHPAVMNAYTTTSSSKPSTDRHQDHKMATLGSLERLYPQHSQEDKSGVPLRQRHLPASFWKEPNVPRFQFLPQCPGIFPFNWHQQGLEYKDFLNRLQAAQLHGVTSPGSRFPITEFLYYNYGMKSRFDGTATPCSDTLWPLGLPQHKKHLTPSVPGTQTVCPYIGCNCTVSTQEATPKGHVHEGQGHIPHQLDLLQSSVWKPIPTKTSSYPTRFHPFTHAR